MNTRKMLTDVQVYELVAYLKGLANDKNHIELTTTEIADGAVPIIGIRVANAAIQKRCKMFGITFKRETLTNSRAKAQIEVLEHRVAVLEKKFREIQAVTMPLSAI